METFAAVLPMFLPPQGDDTLDNIFHCRCHDKQDPGKAPDAKEKAEKEKAESPENQNEHSEETSQEQNQEQNPEGENSSGNE